MKITIQDNPGTGRPVGTINPNHTNRYADISKTYANFSKIQLNCMDQKKVAQAYADYIQAQQNALDDNASITALANEQINVEAAHELYDDNKLPSMGLILRDSSINDILINSDINKLSSQFLTKHFDAGMMDFIMRKMSNAANSLSNSTEYMALLKKHNGTNATTYINKFSFPRFMNVSEISEMEYDDNYCLLFIDTADNNKVNIIEDGSEKMIVNDRNEFEIETVGYYLTLDDIHGFVGELTQGKLAIPKVHIDDDGFSVVIKTIHEDQRHTDALASVEYDLLNQDDEKLGTIVFSPNYYEGSFGINCQFNDRDGEEHFVFWESNDYAFGDKLMIAKIYIQDGHITAKVIEQYAPESDLKFRWTCSDLLHDADPFNFNLFEWLQEELDVYDQFRLVPANVEAYYFREETDVYKNYHPTHNNGRWRTGRLPANNDLLLTYFGCGYVLDMQGSFIGGVPYGLHQHPSLANAQLVDFEAIRTLYETFEIDEQSENHYADEERLQLPGMITTDHRDYDGLSQLPCIIKQTSTGKYYYAFYKKIPSTFGLGQQVIIKLHNDFSANARIKIYGTCQDENYHTEEVIQFTGLISEFFTSGNDKYITIALPSNCKGGNLSFFVQDKFLDDWDLRTESLQGANSPQEMYVAPYNETDINAINVPTDEEATGLTKFNIYISDCYINNDNESYAMILPYGGIFSVKPDLTVRIADSVVYESVDNYYDDYLAAQFVKLPTDGDYVSASHLIYQSICSQSDVKINALNGILTDNVINTNDVIAKIRDISIDNYANIISLSDADFNAAGEYIANFTDKLNQFKIKFGDVSATELQKFSFTFNKWKDKTTSFVSKMTKSMREIKRAADDAIHTLNSNVGISFNRDEPEEYSGSSTVSAWVANTQLTGLKAVGAAAAMGAKAIFSGLKGLFNRIVKPIIKKVVDLVEPLFNGVVLKENKSGTKEGIDIPSFCGESYMNIARYTQYILTFVGFITTGYGKDITDDEIMDYENYIIEKIKTEGKVTKCVETSFCIIQFVLAIDDGEGTSEITMDEIDRETSLHFITQINYKLTNPINVFNNGALNVFQRPVTNVQTTDNIGAFGRFTHNHADRKFYKTTDWAWDNTITVQDQFDMVFTNDEDVPLEFKDTNQDREKYAESIRTAWVKTEWLLFLLFALTTGSDANQIWDKNYTAYKSWFIEQEWKLGLIHIVPPTCEIVDYDFMSPTYEGDNYVGIALAALLREQFEDSVTFEFSSVLPPVNNNQHYQKKNGNHLVYEEDPECVITYSWNRCQMAYGRTIQYKQVAANDLPSVISALTTIWGYSTVDKVSDGNDGYKWVIKAEAPTNAIESYCKYLDDTIPIENAIGGNRWNNKSFISLIQHCDYSDSITSPRKPFGLWDINWYDNIDVDRKSNEIGLVSTALLSIIACNSAQIMVLLNKYYPSDQISCFIPYWDVDYNADFKIRVATDNDNATYGAILITAIAVAVMLVIGIALVGAAAIKIKKLLRTKAVMSDTIEWSSADRCNDSCEAYMNKLEEGNALKEAYKSATGTEKNRIKELLKLNKQEVKSAAQTFVERCKSTAKLKRKAKFMTMITGGFLGAVGSISNRTTDTVESLASSSKIDQMNGILDAADKFSNFVSTERPAELDLSDIDNEIDLEPTFNNTKALIEAFNLGKY